MHQLLTPWRFTIEQYQRMGETGILCEDEPVELIDGVIVAMSPIGDKHISGVDRCTYEFAPKLSGRGIVRVQSPIRLLPRSEPEPDISILRYRADFYRSATAVPADVLLIIEVSDSSLDYDRAVKLPLYAGAGIPETWILNLVNDWIERSWDPADGRYRQHEIVRRGVTLSSVAISGLIISADALLR